MRVIAEIEYEVDDKSNLKKAMAAIKNAPHGSVFSSNRFNTVEFVRVITVKREIKEA